MSSVQSFLKQRVSSTTTFSVPSSWLTDSPVHVYEFVPTQGNYVGNYPPGYMQTSAALSAAINQAVSYASSAGVSPVLRDMGKSIWAPISSTGTQPGVWRQVQLLVPSVVNTATQGLIGGTAGVTFGVLGAAQTPDAYTNYMTFYIPDVSNGLTPLVTLPPTSVIPAGLV